MVDKPVLNPLAANGGNAKRRVNIGQLLSQNLFGETGVDAGLRNTTAIDIAALAASSERDGIEDDAKETRLALILRGVVASSDGLGQAIIEHKKKQQVYRVDDTLALSAKVTLAKVLSDRVVLNNKGVFETLMLYSDSPAVVVATAPMPSQPHSVAIDKRSDQLATSVARDYRNKLYQNPMSLAQSLNITAVRLGDNLQGYQVRPGKDVEQFKRLGFKSGDVVTNVNGIALDDPSKALQLYQIMRGAKEANFEILRDGESISLAVSLGASDGAK
jgi:general secretion pathway protein C